MMNAPYSYGSDYMGGRSRAFSFDGRPAQPAGVSPRYYPSNQPDFRPAYGGGTGYGGGYNSNSGYVPPVAYNTGYNQMQQQPAYNTGYNQMQQQPTAYPSYGGMGMGSMGVTNAGCCPQPVVQQVAPSGSQSAHAFQSNMPAEQCEGLVHRDVQYETEWVAVPVQKPIVYETYTRKVEVPTQHIVNVQNMPGPVPARVCDTGCPPQMGCPPQIGYGGPQPMQQVAPQGYGGGYYGGPPRGASWAASRPRAFSM